MKLLFVVLSNDFYLDSKFLSYGLVFMRFSTADLLAKLFPQNTNAFKVINSL